MLSFSFCYPHVFLPSTLIYLIITTTKRCGKDDIMDVTLSFFFLLTLFLPLNQMMSLNRNREDRANKGDLKISAQTQGIQAMVPIRINIQQHVTEQASFPRSHNPVSSDNQVPTSLPAFDKEKLLAMQARVLQGRLQPNIASPHSMELTKAKIPTGPVKR